MLRVTPLEMHEHLGMLRAMLTVAPPCPTRLRPRAGRRYVTSLTTAAGAAAAVAMLMTGTAPTAEAVPQAATVDGPWVAIADVHGDGHIADFTAAAAPAPGVSILQPAPDGTATLCTTGWAVMSARHDVGYLTAGHCDQHDGAPLWMHTDANSDHRMSLLPLQNSERGADADGRSYDAALFFLSAQQQSRGFGTAIADGVRLRGVLSVDQVQALPQGTPVCMHGSRSGVTCGPLLAAGSDELLWGAAAVKGDSGAPVFVVNADGDALAIGTLSGGPARERNHATYLAPVLDRLKLRAVVEQGDR